jgi:hypothetical protein
VSTGSTFDHTITRDQLITLALRECHELERGEVADADMQADGVMALGLLIRELDDQDIHVHAQQTDTLTLIANQRVYTSANGLPTDIKDLIMVRYRDGMALDNPVAILDRASYEAIREKYELGDPRGVFLTEEIDLSARSLYLVGMLSTVNTQSVVTGSDASAYRCIKGHVGETSNYPITGANWRLYWELGGSGPAVWAAETQYTAPQLLRLTSERPLYDFDAASDNPDIPASHANYLKYLLAARLGGSLTVSEITWCENMADKIYQKTFKKAMRRKTTEIHHKTRYF